MAASTVEPPSDDAAAKRAATVVADATTAPGAESSPPQPAKAKVINRIASRKSWSAADLKNLTKFPRSPENHWSTGTAIDGPNCSLPRRCEENWNKGCITATIALGKSVQPFRTDAQWLTTGDSLFNCRFVPVLRQRLPERPLPKERMFEIASRRRPGRSLFTPWRAGKPAAPRRGHRQWGRTPPEPAYRYGCPRGAR